MSDLASKLFHKYWPTQNPLMADEAEDLVRSVLADVGNLRPIDEWHEDMNDVLCWTIPYANEPVITSPISSDFPEETTHFSLWLLPENISDDGQKIKENK